VIANVAAVGDFAPIAPRVVVIEIDDQAARRSDDFAVVVNADLSFGKDFDLGSDVIAAPRGYAGKARLLHGDQLVAVVHGDRPHADVIFEFFEFEFVHRVR